MKMELKEKLENLTTDVVSMLLDECAAPYGYEDFDEALDMLNTAPEREIVDDAAQIVIDVVEEVLSRKFFWDWRELRDEGYLTGEIAFMAIDDSGYVLTAKRDGSGKIMSVWIVCDFTEKSALVEDIMHLIELIVLNYERQ